MGISLFPLPSLLQEEGRQAYSKGLVAFPWAEDGMFQTCQVPFQGQLHLLNMDCYKRTLEIIKDVTDAIWDGLQVGVQDDPFLVKWKVM